MDEIESRWRAFAIASLGIHQDAIDVGWELLSRMYAGRHYHNLRHVHEMVTRLDEDPVARDSKESRRILESAVWFQDAIYDVRAGQGKNELLSAELATIYLHGAGLGTDPEFIDEVVRCILATRHDAPARDELEALMIDLDLMSLASEPAAYIEHARNIRREYEFADDVSWWKGRGNFLRGMLARSSIYQTARFRLLEGRARANLTAEAQYVGRRLASTAQAPGSL